MYNQRVKELDFKVHSAEQVVGSFASELYRLNVLTPEGEYFDLIYKQFQTGRTHELYVYQHLYPFIKHRMPRLYAMYQDEPKAILLEDLGKSLKVQTKEKHLAPQVICMVLDSLAELHCSAREKIGDWLKAGQVDSYPYADEWSNWTIDQLKKLRDRSDDHSLELDSSITFLERISPHFYELYPTQIKSPVTLTHGDPHLDNIFVKEEKVFFIDWEWVAAASPLRDLSIFLQDIYDDMLQQEIIENYYQALADKEYPVIREQFDHDLKLCLIDNTMMMLGWEIELFFMNRTDRHTLEDKVRYKLDVIKRLGAEFV